MSRYLKQYEKEHMKMAMLKQEGTFKQQVQELHRLYRVQKLLMTEANGMLAIRCNLEEERRNLANDAGSSKSWDAYSEQWRALPIALRESELELTLALGCLGSPGEEGGEEGDLYSVDSRTSNPSSSTESGSPDGRVLPTPSLIGSAAAKSIDHDGRHQE